MTALGRHSSLCLENGALVGLHGADSQVEAFVHARVAQEPPHGPLLHLAVEVAHQTRRLPSFLPHAKEKENGGAWSKKFTMSMYSSLAL